MNIISRIRERAGWSQQDLATALNVSRQAVNFYESGGRRPRPEVAHRILDVAKKHGIKATLADLYPRDAVV